MFLSVGTCTYSDVHCYFLVLVFLSWYEFNTMHLQVKCIMCVFLYRDFFHIMLIILYVYFSTCPHACTRIYDIHISCSIKNSRPGLLIILTIFQTVQWSEFTTIRNMATERYPKMKRFGCLRWLTPQRILVNVRSFLAQRDSYHLKISYTCLFCLSSPHFSLSPSFLSFSPTLSLLPFSPSFLSLSQDHSIDQGSDW